MIKIDEKGQPRFILDQLLMVKEIRELLQKHGTGSIEYSILFGWNASPFLSIESQEDRHEFVMTELEEGGWCSDISHLKRKRGNFFEKEEVVNAIKVINTLFNVPMFDLVQRYRKRIEASEMIVDQIYQIVKNGETQKLYDDEGKESEVLVTGKFDSQNIKRFGDAQNNLNKSIKEMYDDLESAQLKIMKVIETTKECGINDFIKK